MSNLRLHVRKADRLGYYKKALVYLIEWKNKDPNYFPQFGFCYTLELVSNYRLNTYKYLRSLFPELSKLCPKGTVGNTYWFNYNKKGYNTRIKVLKQAIKMLEK